MTPMPTTTIIFNLLQHAGVFAVQRGNVRCEEGRAAASFPDESPIRAASAGRPVVSDFNSFGDREYIFKLDTEVSYRTVHLGMTEQELNGAQIASLSVDLGNLGSAHGMRPIR